ncbi:MAG: O-antigen ligase family protein [Microgenomates group bacterium]
MKFLEVFLLSFYVSQNFNLIKNKAFTKILSISLLLISILGISQFFLARTVNGPFYFLGERSFNISTPGIALQTIKGVDHLRSYSSFSHPNSLAGYLFVSLAILFWLKKEIKLKSKEKLLINISMMFSLISLVLTFSLSALFGGVVFIALLFISKKQSLFEKIFKSSLFVVVMLSISLPFIAGNVTKTNFPKQVEERVGLARVSWKMFLEKPLIGSGLNTFVVNLPNIQNRSSYFWFFQPVHNTILLILSEIGLFGFLLFLYIFNKTQISIIANKNYLIGALLISVMTIGLFDHYFLTLQQNLLSLAFVFGNAFTHKKA